MNKENINRLIELIKDKKKPVCMAFFRYDVNAYVVYLLKQTPKQNSIRANCGTVCCVAGAAVELKYPDGVPANYDRVSRSLNIGILADVLEIPYFQAQLIALPEDSVLKPTGFTLPNIPRSAMVKVLEIFRDTDEISWPKALKGKTPFKVKS